jgi:hypothetical protein
MHELNAEGDTFSQLRFEIGFLLSKFLAIAFDECGIGKSASAAA